MLNKSGDLKKKSLNREILFLTSYILRNTKNK